MILGIGINCDDEGIDGHLDRLAPQLEQAVAAGFDSYELSAEACNIIRGGRIDQPELDQVKAILARYPLRYTVHPPCSLRLTEPSGLHRQVFLSCLEVSGQIGASVMVYHSAQIALLPTDRDVAPLPGAEALHQLWQVETAALLEMAPEAQKRGVIIAVENRDPHLWEVAALARHGKSANDLVTYHQGMRLDLLARQAAELDSASIGICLDPGRALLAAARLPGRRPPGGPLCPPRPFPRQLRPPRR
jgi:sugar phosphate isomerase/epimerase